MFESVRLLEEASKEISREKLDSILEDIEKEEFEGSSIEEIMFSYFLKFEKQKSKYSTSVNSNIKSNAGEESYALAA